MRKRGNINIWRVLKEKEKGIEEELERGRAHRREEQKASYRVSDGQGD